MRDAVKERSREHVSGPCQIFGFSRKRGDERLNAVVADVSAMGTVCHNHGRDLSFEFSERFLGRFGSGNGAGLGFIAEEQVGLL